MVRMMPLRDAAQDAARMEYLSRRIAAEPEEPISIEDRRLARNREKVCAWHERNKPLPWQERREIYLARKRKA